MVALRTGPRFLRVAVLAYLVLPAIACPDWRSDPADKHQARAADAVARILEGNEGSDTYFDAAYGYAVLPGVTRLAAGFGGAYGKGYVVAGDSLVGTTRYWQFSSGIQGGITNFAMLVLFRDEAALENFKSGKFQFVGQAGLDVGPWGVHGTPAWNDGVALYVDTNFGLMAEFSYSGVRYSYRPLPTEP
jgi:lipid-binding SYLF domain-containing protein